MVLALNKPTLPFGLAVNIRPGQLLVERAHLPVLYRHMRRAAKHVHVVMRVDWCRALKRAAHGAGFHSAGRGWYGDDVGLGDGHQMGFSSRTPRP